MCSVFLVWSPSRFKAILWVFVGKLIIIKILSESFRGYRNDRFFKFVSVVVLEFRLPCEQWFLQAGRYATKDVASRLEKPLLARKIPAGRKSGIAPRFIIIIALCVNRSPVRRFSCRPAKKLNPTGML